MLRIENLQKRFGSVAALSSVNFEIQRGEIALLLGSNGAGKSTLLSCIAGVLTPDSGKILFNGEPRRKAKLRIGYLGARTMLYRDLTLRENLKLFAVLNDVEHPEATAELTLESFELGEFGNRLLKQCSAGVQQRAGLARTMLGAPELLLLDEPLSHLDQASRELSRRKFKELSAAGTAFLISTHNVDDIQAFGGKRIELSAGRIHGTV